MNIASHITESAPLPGIRLFTAKTGAKDIVTIYGSMLGGHFFGPEHNAIIPEMTVMMLDEGTTKHSKEEIHTLLESVGASLNFSCYNHDIGFSIQCLVKDVPLVFDVLAEELREPAFNPENLALEKKRTIAELLRMKDDTGKQAEIALSQALFPKGHPNYDDSIATTLEQVEKVTSEELREYHQASYGLGTMAIVATGDIQPSALEGIVAKAFKGWHQSSLVRGVRTLQGKTTSRTMEIISLPDKASVDVNMGQALGIEWGHPDFYPLSIGNHVLGSHGFTARLMSTVRDREGLTYGIYSGIGGIREGDDGYWFVSATFAPDLVQKGLRSSTAQIETWQAKGISAQELAQAKDKITGGYKVSLATTRGLASAILNVIEQGKAKEFLDQYPDVIRSLTLKQVNDAIKKYIDPAKIVTVAAGSIDPKGNPLA